MAEQPNPKCRSPVTLNDLPCSLLIHILTLLPILSAIETSFISRQWRNLWHSMPTLKFERDDEYYDGTLFPNEGDYDVGFANTITQVLANSPKSNPLHVFDLKFTYDTDHHYRSFATTWISYALDCNVEDMRLHFDCSGNDLRYRLHFSIMKNKHVRCLKLYRCEIVMPPVDSIQFDSLQVLYLNHVLVNDEELTDLISRCKNLEKLHLVDFDGLRNFKIHSKSLKVLKLKYCDTHDDYSIEIHTPNLSKIKVENCHVEISAGDLPSLKLVQLLFCINLNKCWGYVRHLNMLRRVECLKVKELFPRYVLPKFNTDGSFQFERLKHLEVQVGSTLDDILGVCVLLERAPSLESLVFNDSGWSTDEESLSEEFNHLPFKLHIPSLLEVKMIGFKNTKFEHGILLLLWKHGVVLNKVVLVPHATLGEPTIVLDPTSNDIIKFLVERRIG